MKNFAVAVLIIGASVNLWAASDSSTVTTKYPYNNYANGGILSRIVPQASLVMSDYQGSVPGYGVSPNYGFGATVEFGRSQLVLETGLLYRAFGATFQAQGYHYTIQNGYAALPLFGKYYFSDSTGSSFYAKGGVVPSYLVNKSINTNINGVDTSYLPISYFEFEAAAGIGDRIALSSNNDLMVELTYNRGYTNIVSDGSTSIYNEAFMLTAGFSFDL